METEPEFERSGADLRRQWTYRQRRIPCYKHSSAPLPVYHHPVDDTSKSPTIKEDLSPPDRHKTFSATLPSVFVFVLSFFPNARYL